eukprot:CAMPEP_0175788082 /NCGR_PEP_ID=MMETSP0097-20121207/80687_1 /TAXON_ID=311494 /ORGANISM="Alexandrium monilatum, Strain CCMP3105" /LENGTH=33 /DNA_ID= /DNA_START= /DNA_END= /DNA_ORIENTATION=
MPQKRSGLASEGVMYEAAALRAVPQRTHMSGKV